jgi:hypothetical protein
VSISPPSAFAAILDARIELLDASRY